MKKTMILFVFLAMVAINTVFSQAVTIDVALSNATKDISEGVSKGSKIAILNITSDSTNLSDYIINELIVNLVNTRLFQIVPRSTVELAAARREFAFQMSGDVPDDSQKRLGQFLEADTIITGSVTRDSANTYRLIVNAIHLENFTFQSSFRASIQNDRQVRTLFADSGGVFYEDYTAGQRFGIAALNTFFGIGSIANGHHIGWVVSSGEIIGGVLLAIGLGMNPQQRDFAYDWDPNNPRNKYDGFFWDSDRKSYESALEAKDGLIISGAIIAGSAVLFGYIIPSFHHKPNNTISQNNLPFNLELVSSSNQDINGIKILYNMKF
jgi:TolB-like protein